MTRKACLPLNFPSRATAIRKPRKSWTGTVPREYQTVTRNDLIMSGSPRIIDSGQVEDQSRQRRREEVPGPKMPDEAGSFSRASAKPPATRAADATRTRKGRAPPNISP